MNPRLFALAVCILAVVSLTQAQKPKRGKKMNSQVFKYTRLVDDNKPFNEQVSIPENRPFVILNSDQGKKSSIVYAFPKSRNGEGVMIIRNNVGRNRNQPCLVANIVNKDITLSGLRASADTRNGDTVTANLEHIILKMTDINCTLPVRRCGRPFMTERLSAVPALAEGEMKAEIPTFYGKVTLITQAKPQGTCPDRVQGQGKGGRRGPNGGRRGPNGGRGGPNGGRGGPNGGRNGGPNGGRNGRRTRSTPAPQ